MRKQKKLTRGVLGAQMSSRKGSGAQGCVLQIFFVFASSFSCFKETLINGCSIFILLCFVYKLSRIIAFIEKQTVNFEALLDTNSGAVQRIRSYGLDPTLF